MGLGLQFRCAASAPIVIGWRIGVDLPIDFRTHSLVREHCDIRSDLSVEESYVSEICTQFRAHNF